MPPSATALRATPSTVASRRSPFPVNGEGNSAEYLVIDLFPVGHFCCGFLRREKSRAEFAAFRFQLRIERRHLRIGRQVISRLIRFLSIFRDEEIFEQFCRV